MKDVIPAVSVRKALQRLAADTLHSPLIKYLLSESASVEN